MNTTESFKAREARKELWVGRLSYLLNRVYALGWVLATMFVVYYSNFFLVIWENEYVNSLFFTIALISFGIFASMTLYAAFVIKNIDDIEITSPRVIPVATLFGFICFNSSMIAFWPVWGWYTPLMLFTMLMGYVMVGSFMPKGNLGSAAFLVLLTGSAFSSNFIPHQGLLH
jgi:hypothetical protein